MKQWIFKRDNSQCCQTWQLIHSSRLQLEAPQVAPMLKRSRAALLCGKPTLPTVAASACRSYLNERFDFQVIFEYFLFTYSDVDIWGRHVADAVHSNYGKQEVRRDVYFRLTAKDPYAAGFYDTRGQSRRTVAFGAPNVKDSVSHVKLN